LPIRFSRTAFNFSLWFLAAFYSPSEAAYGAK
jgi:hypothetical protein